MKKIPTPVRDFFHRQHFVFVITFDLKGFPHIACKGIVDIDERGIVKLLDLYRRFTYANLQSNSALSIAAVDEGTFKGYGLKGHARALPFQESDKLLLERWDKALLRRVSKRIVEHLKKENSSLHHPEATMPHPVYVIELKVEEIVDLSPPGAI